MKTKTKKTVDTFFYVRLDASYLIYLKNEKEWEKRKLFWVNSRVTIRYRVSTIEVLYYLQTFLPPRNILT